MNAPTASGSDASIALADALQRTARVAYGFGTGSATIAGCDSSAGRDRRQRHVAGLQRAARSAIISARERRVHEPLDRRHAAIARRQLQHAAAALARSAG